MPKVSVIVTTYNRKEYLTETIQSILNQTYQDFELIVVDNFSNYDFFAHIKSLKNEKIIPFQNQNNGIIAVNRNVGIKHAKGEFIAFCDDDDIWIPEKLERQMNNINEKGSDLVSSSVKLFKTDIKQQIGIQKNKLIKNVNDFLNQNQIKTSSVLVKKSNKLIFQEDKNLISIEDYALWLELYLAGYKFSFINEPLVYYRLFDNISKKNWSINHLRIIYLFISLKINYPELKILKQVLKHLIKYILKNIYLKVQRL